MNQPDRYRHRRTAEIDAIQWTGNNADQLTAFAPDRFATAAMEDRIDPEDDAHVLIEESHWVAIRPGCWVLKYPDHFDVESDADFRAAWEPVVQSPADRTAQRERIAAAVNTVFERWAEGLGEQPTQDEARLCGKTRGVDGSTYQPCARPAGHPEAYCRSADGNQHFLAAQLMDPVNILGIGTAPGHCTGQLGFCAEHGVHSLDEVRRCSRCTHPKRDHDGRTDHREKHSPLVAGEPWCHACNAACDYVEPST